MKTCTRCNEEKESSAFYKNKLTQDGLASWCKDCTKDLNKSKNYDRTYNIKRHGITIVEYEKLLLKQGGVCAICKTDRGSRSLNIDHDHSCCPGTYSCGKCVRGLLCGSCNRAIGALNEDPILIQNVLSYLLL